MEQRNLFKCQDFINSLNIVFVEEAPVTTVEQPTKPPAAVELNIRDATTQKRDNPDAATISACATCKKSFSNLEEQQAHYKSNWHRFNLKLRVAGLKRVSEEDFLQIEASTQSTDASESTSQKSNKKSNAKSESSSSSTSTNSVEEDAADSEPLLTTQADIELEISTVVRTGTAKVSFYAKNATEVDGFTKLSVWKSVLLPKSKENDSLSYLNALKDSPKKQQWTILMCTGGYFAGAIFRNKEVLQHKRIARYTVRRKQGGAQASKDASDPSRAPQSAGAFIRRQNEKKLKEEIAELLKNWKPLIDQSDLIFLFAPSYNRWSFLYEGSPVRKEDPRLRKVPFATRRPSFMELKRVQETLSTVDIATVPNPPALEQKQQTASTSSSSSVPLLRQSVDSMNASDAGSEHGAEDGDEEVETDLLLEAVRSHDLVRLQSLLDEGYEQPIPFKKDAEWHTPLSLAYELGKMDLFEFLLDTDDADVDFRLPHKNFQTVLHLAARKGDQKTVEALLDAGADPTVREIHELTPFDVCEDKDTRLLFRRFAGDNPDMWDYEAAHIPAPLSRETEEERKRKEAEKRKKKKQQQKEKKKIQKAEEELERHRQVEEELKRQKKAEDERAAIEAQKERERKLAGMSEREKRAYAAEMRLAGASAVKKCDNCGIALTMVPFERLNYKYCSTDCVMKHKKTLEGAKNLGVWIQYAISILSVANPGRYIRALANLGYSHPALHPTDLTK